MAFNITTTAFEEGAMIPVRNSCDGDNTSPHLRWDEAPKATVTFALIVEDPDAPGGTFTHWIVYNLPADCNELEAIMPIAKKLDNGAIQGKNDMGKYGYGGPCPPKGETHRYFFRIFALKKKLAPESANTRETFYQQIEGNVLDEAEYMGKYKH
ncbi:MAG TPA: YbhB/YbcL family Raf kinase inhibitor-like protein [Bacteroidales bacterium]|nr:YbhB/YbcL family Raf kinase inhibitor-like protein [Bacteroidales bacterium]